MARAGLSDWDLDAMRRIRAHIRAYQFTEKVSQNEVAKRCFMTSGNLSKLMKKDENGLGVGQVLKLALGLGISAEKLLADNPDARFFDGEPIPTPLRRIPASLRK